MGDKQAERKIVYGFPGEHPDYHAYEALQIFNAISAFPELRPNQTFEYFEEQDSLGQVTLTIRVPEFTSAHEHARFLYRTMSEFTGYSSPWGCITGIRPAKIASGYGDKAFEMLTGFYMATEQKANLAIKTAHLQKPFLDNQKACPENVGIYVGIPFCPTRCLYCSFTSNSIEKYAKRVSEYLDALSEEMKATRELTDNHNLKIESVYLGGGTPTSLSEADFERFMSDVTKYFTKNNENIVEFSLEAGRPDSITRGKLEIAKKYGVTRLSVNPQTMHQCTLDLIGRKHSVESVISAFDMARKIGFDNINMDIIAGLPGETVEMFQKTVDKVIEMAPDSVTVHTLSVKRAANLRTDSKKEMLEGEIVAEMVRYAGEKLTNNAYNPYYMYRQKNMLGNHENVAYCKAGKESPYNIHIMEEDQTILACGAGGVSKRVDSDNSLAPISRAFNVKGVEEYLLRYPEMITRKIDLLS